MMERDPREAGILYTFINIYQRTKNSTNILIWYNRDHLRVKVPIELFTVFTVITTFCFYQSQNQNRILRQNVNYTSMKISHKNRTQREP